MTGYDWYVLVEAICAVVGTAFAALIWPDEMPDGDSARGKIVNYMALFFVACIAGLISVVAVPHTVIDNLALRWVNLIFTPFFAGLLASLLAMGRNADAQGAKFSQGFLMAFGFLLIRSFVAL